MGRKSNPFARPYKLTVEALEQRRKAAIERWQSADEDARKLPGRPRKKLPQARDSHGRFVSLK